LVMAAGVLAALMIAGAGAPALAQDRPEIVLVNGTAGEIDQIYLSPMAAADWSENLLGLLPLGLDGGIALAAQQTTLACLWDVKAVFIDYDTATWNGVDFCGPATIVLHRNKATGETWAESQ
jgi:hypothetical protein